MKKSRETVHDRQGKLLEKVTIFWADDAGNATIETVIWLPIYAIMMSLIMNISMVFFNESQLLRVVQDGNRAFSLGRLDNAEAVQNYILNQLAYLGANLTVSTTVSGGFVMTTLDVPAGNLMPLNLMHSAFDGVTINVSAQHIVEF